MRGAVRSWLIRGLILAGVAGLVAAAWVASSWVSPERVRQKVVEHLAEQFDGVDVHVGSARMRILGGIAVTDLKLTRRGDPAPFLVVPAAVIYHDKEQLSRGDVLCAPGSLLPTALIDVRIELLPGKGYEDALSDLELWTHLWVLYVFDRAEGFRPKVLPPRSGASGERGSSCSET